MTPGESFSSPWLLQGFVIHQRAQIQYMRRCLPSFSMVIFPGYWVVRSLRAWREHVQGGKHEEWKTNRRWEETDKEEQVVQTQQCSQCPFACFSRVMFGELVSVLCHVNNTSNAQCFQHMGTIKVNRNLQGPFIFFCRSASSVSMKAG